MEGQREPGLGYRTLPGYAVTDKVVAFSLYLCDTKVPLCNMMKDETPATLAGQKKQSKELWEIVTSVFHNVLTFY